MILLPSASVEDVSLNMPFPPQPSGPPSPIPILMFSSALDDAWYIAYKHNNKNEDKIGIKSSHIYSLIDLLMLQN